MRFRVSAVALGLGALVGTPCLALTVQAAPPRPDVAQHLRSQTSTASSVLPNEICPASGPVTPWLEMERRIICGFAARNAATSSPSRSNTPRRKFSSTTSLAATSRSSASRPSACLRLILIARLPRLLLR